jgi:hypothetical protein
MKSGRKRGKRRNMNVELRFSSTFKISKKNLCKYLEIYIYRGQSEISFLPFSVPEHRK